VLVTIRVMVMVLRKSKCSFQFDEFEFEFLFSLGDMVHFKFNLTMLLSQLASSMNIS
jgi:hypothetical protein